MTMYIKRIYSTGSRPARMYSLPNYIKYLTLYQHLAFRPILLSIGTYNYQSGIFLGNLLGDVIAIDHSAKDTFSFIEELKKVKATYKCMFLYDVTSFFTNMPLE